MDDMISRQALMKEFSDFVRASNNSDFARTPTWNDAVSLVGSMPSAQPEPHWIPCSEVLPKYPFRVQIQLDNGWIITGYYSEEHWYTVPHCGGFLRNDEVEAWRELPKPYGGESDD